MSSPDRNFALGSLNKRPTKPAYRSYPGGARKVDASNVSVIRFESKAARKLTYSEEEFQASCKKAKLLHDFEYLPLSDTEAANTENETKLKDVADIKLKEGKVMKDHMEVSNVEDNFMGDKTKEDNLMDVSPIDKSPKNAEHEEAEKAKQQEINSEWSDLGNI